VLVRRIRRADVDRLVLTSRYQMLVDAAGGLLPLAGHNPAERGTERTGGTGSGERTSEFSREITAMEEQDGTRPVSTRLVVAG
jgi:hypothetical protein